MESRNRLVTMRWSGFRTGKSFAALRSSISRTASFFRHFPPRVAAEIRAVAAPASMFAPFRLETGSSPQVSKTSQSILETVVFPLVPVTPMSVSGRPMRERKSGQTARATMPGPVVPPRRRTRRASCAALAVHRAI